MKLRVPANVMKWSDSKSELEIWVAAPEVVVQRARGHATIGSARAIAAFVEPLIASGKKLTLFDDWEDVTGYDTDGRIELTTWTNRHRPSLLAIHILVRSKLLAMGIAVANLATNGINVTYSSRPEFEQALALAIASNQALLPR